MGDIVQYDWLRRHRHLAQEPILEIGSKHYEAHTSVRYRDAFPGADYTGCDMLPGVNVDLVIDFTLPFAEINALLQERRFRTVICCSVMEHVEDIYAFSRNLTDIIELGGVLFMSVPFVWRFHGYPSDYWRFTPRAIKFLYKEFTWADHLSETSANFPNSAMEADTSDPRVVNERAMASASSAQMDGPPYFLAPTMLSMIGYRKVPGASAEI